jgi:hypothetical protein
MRCAATRLRISDADAGLVCTVNAMSGMRQCIPQDAGVTSDLPTRSYTNTTMSCPDAGADGPADAANDGP